MYKKNNFSIDLNVLKKIKEMNLYYKVYTNTTCL